MTIKECQKKSHENAMSKGFWDDSQNISEKLMLIVSEIGEACEALRSGKPLTLAPDDMARLERLDERFEIAFKTTCKDTFGDELGDALIRIVDLAEYLGIDLETHVRLKMKYNESQPINTGKRSNSKARKGPF